MNVYLLIHKTKYVIAANFALKITFFNRIGYLLK